MTRRSWLISALASGPVVAGLLMFSGCDSGKSTTQTDADRNPGNQRNKEAMDYMRQQYQSKQQKKR